MARLHDLHGRRTVPARTVRTCRSRNGEKGVRANIITNGTLILNRRIAKRIADNLLPGGPVSSGLLAPPICTNAPGKGQPSPRTVAALRMLN